MKRALVCGAGGFIGGHLVKKLKREGYWVRGVDIKEHESAPTAADEFLLLDLREPENCKAALTLEDGHPSTSPWSSGTCPGPFVPCVLGPQDQGLGPQDQGRQVQGPRTEGSGQAFDGVYQLAADMGGMGFIPFAECEIMHNNALINIHMIHAAAQMGVSRYFFSSSVCVYRDMQPGEPELTEDDAIPANPDNEYGWEKLYAERVAMAYGRHYDINIRIARFQNCYGPEGAWRGGREKAPAAICRKVAEAEDGGIIKVWGDGTAIRAYTYVDDMVEGIYMLMQSDPSAGPWSSGTCPGPFVPCVLGPQDQGLGPKDQGRQVQGPRTEGSGHCLEGPTNIGSSQYVTVDELVETVIEIAGKEIHKKYVEGPVGVQARNFSKGRIHSLGWEAKVSLKEGIARTYPWIEAQVKAAKRNEK